MAEPTFEDNLAQLEKNRRAIGTRGCAFGTSLGPI